MMEGRDDRFYYVTSESVTEGHPEFPWELPEAPEPAKKFWAEEIRVSCMAMLSMRRKA